MTRQEQIEAMVVVAAAFSKNDTATTISLLVGALTMACGASVDPAAALAISIDSLGQARAICEERLS